jgi:3-hydroxyisobutyrate dehydrogenase-like beta-hydroxyacid dehydrogenase
VARSVDVVQIVVADPEAVRGILDRIAPALDRDKTVVQSSTIDPRSSDEFRSSVLDRGARYLEAPFTGSKAAAEQKQTVFYLGGARTLIAEIEPLLALVSATRFTIGDHRQAATLKLAMNLNIAAQMEALAEALTMVRRAGISDDTFFEAIAVNTGYSGLTKIKESKLRTNEFSPQFSVKHMLKDMRLISAMKGGSDFPILDTVRECLAAADHAGFADEDFSVLIKLLETRGRSAS